MERQWLSLSPPPHFYKAITIQEYAAKNDISNLIETGTYLGETVEACLPVFKKIISIELAPELFRNAQAKFANEAKVELHEGDSGEVLEHLLLNITEPCLFWLDGHYSEGFTAKGKLNTPVIKELTHILNHRVKGHVILIDDARCFTGEDDYPTIEELIKIVHQHDADLIFSVKYDIIRIHSDSLLDIDEFGNQIYSEEVSLQSLYGHHIEIWKQTAIDCRSQIGSYTYIGNRVTITKSKIGRYCSIGDNVSIGPGEHDLSLFSTSALFYSDPLPILTSKDCVIGHDVWIGVDSIIKRGVEVGNGAIVGANSVVTKDVPAFAIVAGSPAKIIRYRFDPAKIAELIESNWWSVDIELAKKILKQIPSEK